MYIEAVIRQVQESITLQQPQDAELAAAGQVIVEYLLMKPLDLVLTPQHIPTPPVAIDLQADDTDNH
jgi:hypothetical protein